MEEKIIIDRELVDSICKYCEDQAIYDKLGQYNDFYYKLKRSTPEGTFVNVDEIRDDFTQEVYRVLDADSTNDRANQIIDAFDSLPVAVFQKSTKDIVETWKEMRLEVYQRASGNRHEPNCSDDTTKMFSLNDIDEIIEKISEKSLLI